MRARGSSLPTAAVALLLHASGLSAQPSRSCDGPWSLIDPVPARCLTPIETDRPHLTETPMPAPAGHLQLESGLVVPELDAGGVQRVAVLEQIYKLGLYSRLDLELLWIHAEFTPSPLEADPSAPLVRSKILLLEEDGPLPALSLVPFVTLPWPGDAIFETGGWVYLSWALGDRLELEVNVGGSAWEEDENWGPAFYLAGALTGTVWGDVAVFGELFSATYDRPDGFELIHGTGLVWLVEPRLQLDAGAYIGLVGPVAPVAPFLGLSVLL